MAETALVTEDIEAADRLVDMLDQHGLPVRSAMWLYESDAERWRFVICFREDRENYMSFYRDMARVFNQNLSLNALELDRVGVVRFEGSIFSQLRGVVNIQGKSRVRFSHNRINGVYLEDAMIYRLEA